MTVVQDVTGIAQTSQETVCMPLANNRKGRHHENNLRLFLDSHYLSGHEVDAVCDMLLAQVKTQARFRDACGACHGIAAEFVWNSLELRDVVLCGRDTGEQARVFLAGHRAMASDDIEYFDSLLARKAHDLSALMPVDCQNGAES